MKVFLERLRQSYRFILRLIVSLLLIGFLFAALDFKELGSLFGQISIWKILITPIIYWLGVLFCAWRWRKILDKFKIHERIIQLMRWNITSTFWSNFLPSTVGGDSYRFLSVRKRFPGMDAIVFSSILLDRAYGFLTLLLTNLLFSVFYFPILRENLPLLWLELGIAIAIIGGVILWIFRATFLRWEIKIQYISGLWEKVKKVINLVEQQDAATVFWACLYSFFFILGNAITIAICYLAIGMPVDWIAIFYASTLASVIGAIPVTINGLGSVEAIYIMTLAASGISKESILLVAILSRSINAAMALIGGIAYLLEIRS